MVSNFDTILIALRIFGGALGIIALIYFAVTKIAERKLNKWTVIIIVIGIFGYASAFYYPLFFAISIAFIITIFLLYKFNTPYKSTISIVLLTLSITLSIITFRLIITEKQFKYLNNEAIENIKSKPQNFVLFDSIIYNGVKHQCEMLSKKLSSINLESDSMFINHLKKLKNKNNISPIILIKLKDIISHYNYTNLFKKFEKNIVSGIDTTQFIENQTIECGIIPKSKLIELDQTLHIKRIKMIDYSEFQITNIYKKLGVIENMLDSINYAIINKLEYNEIGTYSTGGKGFQRLLHLYVYQIDSNSIIGHYLILGDEPPKHLDANVLNSKDDVYGIIPKEKLDNWYNSHTK